MTERSHQLWASQVLQGQHFTDWDQLFQTLQRRRDFLNHQLPCATLDEQPPLVAHPEALTNVGLYRPEWEADLLDLSRIHAYLAQGRWFRLVSHAGTFSLGGRPYYLDPTWAKQQVEITFNPADLHFLVHAPNGDLIKRFFPSGMTISDLMGDLLADKFARFSTRPPLLLDRLTTGTTFWHSDRYDLVALSNCQF